MGLSDMNEGNWPAPLPEFEKLAIRQRFRIGHHEFRLFVSDIQREVQYEPDTDLIHLSVEYGGQPKSDSRNTLGLNLASFSMA